MYPSKVQETPMMQERKYENWRCELKRQEDQVLVLTAIAGCLYHTSLLRGGGSVI